LALRKLIIRAAEGDKDAENEFIGKLHARFLELAKRRVGEKDADDLAQETCVTILERYKSLPTHDHFEAWCYKILRNKIGNYLRKSGRRSKFNAPTFSDESANAPIDAGDPDFENRLLECLKRVYRENRRYARVLNLAHQGYDGEEICRRLGLKRNNFYALLRRSRAMLWKFLREED
jgi:RNA polymerase sigma factor (sigma-70 family)